MSPFLQAPALVAVLLALAACSTAANSYSLSDHFDASNFPDSFDFFDQADPTHGFVQYASKSAAQSQLLAGKTTNGAIYLGTDATTKGSPRASVRVSSKKTYQQHLMIADVAHMPYAMGAWPALWELGAGAEWPTNGEIDILEGVNNQATNLMTLHTSANCQMTKNPSAMSGSMTSTDCYVNSGSQPGNAGCSVSSTQPTSFGQAFNAAGGGVYAMEYTADAITIWFFDRQHIPADIASGSGSPDVSSWGTPQAKFQGCDLASHFKNMQIVINTDVCGDWAGNVWNTAGADGQSPAKITGSATCQDYAANNPQAFDQAYWAINSIRVYEQGKAASKRQEIFGAYNATDDAGLSNCEEFTPGHCNVASKSQDTVHSAAPSLRSSWALIGLAVVGTVIANL